MACQNGPTSKSETRKCYDVSFKLQAVEYAKAVSKEGAARKFKVDAKRIREWCKQESHLQVLKEQNGIKRKRLEGAGRKLTSENLEQILLEWIENQRGNKIRVSRKMIMRKAKEMFEQEELPDATRDTFEGSRGWVDKFLKRNNLTIRKRTTASQKTPDQLIPKLVSFVLHIRALRLRFDYPLPSIGAMDETAVWVDMLAETTVESVGSKSVGIKTTGNQKSKFTICLTAKANGVKLSPFVVFKGKRADPELAKMPGIVVAYSANGWMNGTLTIQWLEKVWGLFAFGRRLLVWDSYRCHISDATKSEVRKLQTDMAVIPGGCTGLIQAPDVVWNSPFKAAYRELYEEWMLNGEKSYTKAGNMRPPTRRLMCQWVKKAWDTCLTSEQIRSSFQSCGVTVSTDGSEDNLITCFKEGREA